MRVLRAFESAGLEYVLIGAAAMGFHGLIRATPAFDLIIRATPDNIEKLRAALRAAYEGDPSIDEISTTDLLGEYPLVRYVPPTGDLFFDVMTRLGEVVSFDTLEAEVTDLNGTHVRVATPAALYRLKKGTVRSQDHVDAAALRDRFNLKDEVQYAGSEVPLDRGNEQSACSGVERVKLRAVPPALRSMVGHRAQAVPTRRVQVSQS